MTNDEERTGMREDREEEPEKARQERARNAALRRWENRGPKTGMVTLPYSGHRRSCDPYCALILRAPRFARAALEMEQVILRPGATIPLDSLWPTPDAPRIPVLLECTISPRARQGVCPFKSECLYVLWRWVAAPPEIESVPATDAHARVEGTWLETARCLSMDGDWFAHLHPIIVRELERSGAQPVAPDLAARCQSAAAFLDELLHDLSDDERARLLTSVHDRLAGRIAATGHSVHTTPTFDASVPPGTETQVVDAAVASPPARIGPGTALSPVRLPRPRTAG